MWTIIFQRFVSAVLTLIIVSMIIFCALEFLPGGFAEAMLGHTATPEAVEAFNKQLGLDRPATIRYFEWISGILRGDFGYSYTGVGASTKISVAEIVAPRLYNTFFLAAVAALIAVPLSVSLGLAAALYRNTWFDRCANTFTLTAIALPEFFIAYVLMFGFAVKLHWFYSLSTVNMTTSLGEHLLRVVLPALTLTLVIAAHMMRMTRASILNVLASPYIEMANLKGIAPATVILRHALPNVWGPIATVIAFNLAYLIVGVVVVEVAFVYPGIGQLMVDAVSSRNMPVVQACALIFAATYILLNLAADIVTVVTNPRLVHPR